MNELVVIRKWPALQEGCWWRIVEAPGYHIGDPPNWELEFASKGRRYSQVFTAKKETFSLLASQIGEALCDVPETDS